MNDFLKLNKGKIIFFSKSMSILGFVILLIILLINIFLNNEIVLLDYTYGFVLLSIAFPLFIFVLAYLEWFFSRRRRKKGYDTAPFNKLDEIGFKKIIKNEETKWYFSEVIKVGTINDIEFICDITKEEPKKIQFITGINPDKLKNSKKLKSRLNENDIEFEGFLVIKKIRINNELNSIIELESILQNITKILKEENL